MQPLPEVIIPGKMHPGKIGALIITYNPGPGFQQRLQRITKQVSRTLVVDNGSRQPVLDLLRSLPPDMNIELILNGENLGVAHALNQGMAWGKDNHYEWMLTMDQDSEVNDDIIKKLSGIINSIQSKINIGVIGSNYYDKFGNHRLSKQKMDAIWLERSFVITSGSLVSIEAFAAIGGCREDFFIDSVDHDYCIRLRKQGYVVGMSTEPLMTHSLGNKTRHKLFGLNLVTSNHQAFRRYYMSRNRVVLAKKHFFIETKFVMYLLFQTIIEMVAVIIFEKEKTKKLRAIANGLWDGIRGRMGKIKTPDFP